MSSRKSLRIISSNMRLPMTNAKQKVFIKTLGCDKNTVDSENIIGHLMGKGFTAVAAASDADIIIINTCCFIDDAKKQSIETIFDYLPYKTEGDCHTFIVAGCMAERYAKELKEELPEVDYFTGVNRVSEIGDIIQKQNAEKIYTGKTEVKTQENKRYIAKGRATAFLKISEGCDHHCTYCVIPKIRGKHRSRPLDDLLSEAEKLFDSGVKELVLVAQDLTQYGSDLPGDTDLSDLLDALCARCRFTWIRLLYLYPEGINDKLLKTIASHPEICHYFDIPIQHTEDSVLSRMARSVKKTQIIETVEQIRRFFPDAVLRTTVICGFPGESQDDFSRMHETLKTLRFDRLGAFAYSREEGTPAYAMPDQIADHIKAERTQQIYDTQKLIIAEANQNQIGQIFTTLIEEVENGVSIGRTFRDAPEVDCDVIIEDATLKPGRFYQIEIIDAIDYDLIGRVHKQ